MSLDPRKSAEDMMTDLINQSNASNPSFRPFQYNVLKFRNVEDSYLEQEFDTTVQVTNAAEPEEGDWASLWYNRASITRVINRIPPAMAYDEAYTDVHAMLEDINARFGVNLTSADIENSTIEVPETGPVYPITVPVVTKATALIYRGSTAIYLEDPAKGDHIITPVVTSDDAELTLTTSLDLPTQGYRITNNGELQTAANIIINDTDRPSQGTGGTYREPLGDDDTWSYAFSAGLINTINNVEVLHRYQISLKISNKTSGFVYANLALTKIGQNYALANAERTIVFESVAIDETGTVIQGVISNDELTAILLGAELNPANAAKGQYTFDLSARLQSGAAVPVRNVIIADTMEGVKRSMSILTPVEELQLTEEGPNTIPVTLQVRVTGPAGVGAVTAGTATISRTVTNNAVLTFDAYEVNGVIMNPVNQAITIPSGTPKGTYEFTGTLDVGTEWNAETYPELTLKYSASLTTFAEHTWTINAVETTDELPTVVTAPTIEGDVVEGSTLTLNPGSYTGDNLTVTQVLYLLTTEDDPSPSEMEFEGTEVVVTEAHVGKYMQLIETVSNSAGTVESQSDIVGPFTAAVVAPTFLTDPSINGELMDGATITADYGTVDDETATIEAFIYVAESVEDDERIAVVADGETTYTLNFAEPAYQDMIGKYLYAEVTATNSAGSVTAQSTLLGPLPTPA